MFKLIENCNVDKIYLQIDKISLISYSKISRRTLKKRHGDSILEWVYFQLEELFYNIII